MLGQFRLRDSNPGPLIPKQRWYHYTKGYDPEVQKNRLLHYIPPPFEERRIEWGDSIYHSVVVCTQSCSIKQACIYTTKETSLDEICIHTNCSIDSFWTPSSPISRVSSSSKIRTRDLRFQSKDDTTTPNWNTQNPRMRQIQNVDPKSLFHTHAQHYTLLLFTYGFFCPESSLS